MVRLSFDACTVTPKSHCDAVPAPYSKLGPDRRIAVRDRYVELQHGLCWHCKLPLSGPPCLVVQSFRVNWHRFPGREAGFLKHPVHLHHDHKTDMTIGAVHAYCNAVLWQHYGE